MPIKNDEIIEFYNTHGFGNSDTRFREIIRGLNPFIKKDGSAIDIGCGTGVITRHLARAMTVIGIDIADKKIEYARKNSSNPNATYICEDFIEYAKTNSATFDLITLCDVFEHIDKSRLPEFVKGFMGMAHEKTKIYMNIPDSRFLSFMRVECPGKLQVVDEPHSIESILGMFSKFGFGPVKIRIYGIGSPIQYNEIVFIHNASVIATHAKTYIRKLRNQ